MSKYPGRIVSNLAPAGYSVFFDGTGDFLSTASNAAFGFGTGDATIEVWIYPTTVAGTQVFVDTRVGSAAGIGIYLSGATLSVAKDVTTVLMQGGTVAANTWSHVAWTRSGSTNRLFLNGVQTTSTTDSTNYPTTRCFVGSTDSNSQNFNGYISNVRVVKGTALYTAAFTPPTQLFNITNTSLLTCNSPALVDQSSNAFTITANGNAAVSTFTPFTAYVPYNPALGASTPGIWTVDEAMQAAATRQWNMYDPYFNLNTLLLHGNGTNGAQNNTFLDSSSNNFTITRNGNTTQGSFSPFSQAPGYWSNYFDGTGDYLRFPDSSAGYQMGSGDFTVECWIFPTAATSLGRIFNNWGSTTAAAASWEILQVSTGIHFYCSTNGSTSQVSITSGTITVGVWSHIAAVRSGNVFTLYINGISAGTTTQAITLQTANTCTIAARNSGGSYIENFAGYVSNARVVKGTAVYTGNFTLSSIPFTAVTNTQILTCQSNRFVDNSTNNYTLTIVGDTSTQPFSPFYPTAAYTPQTIGGSGFFDGNADVLSAVSNAAFAFGTGDFTMEAWINPASLTTDTLLCGIDATSGAIFGYSATTVWLGSRSASYDLTATYTIPLNTWTHLAVSRQGTTARIFANGVQIASGTVTNNYAQGQFAVGNYVTANIGVVGYLSNVRVVKGTAVYTGAFTPPRALIATSGAVSAAAYPSTTNVNTSFAASNTSLLLNFTNAGVVDSTGDNVLETIGNASISTAFSKFGGSSMFFDGTGDALMSRNSSNFVFGTGNFTIEAWVYPTARGVYPMICKCAVDGTWATGWALCFGYQTTEDKLQFWINGSTILQSTNAVPLNTWSHIAVARFGTSLRMFVNGVQEASATNSTAISPTSVFTVGSDVTPTNYNYFGYIDDLRITKVARYTAAFTPQTSQWQDQ